VWASELLVDPNGSFGWFFLRGPDGNYLSRIRADPDEGT
jgi:hypothetical protein